MTLRSGALAIMAMAGSLAAPVYAQAPESQPSDAIAAREDHPHNEPDNGTDPTRVRRSVTASFEHTDLRGGFDSDAFELDFSQPIGSHSSITLTANAPGVDVAGDTSIGLGDTEVVLTHIPVVTHRNGIVFKLGVIFDTASRPELGSGNTVLEGTFIHAWFLEGGHIFAPSFEYNVGVERDPGRARVNQLTTDFYFVPRLKDRRYYMTVDPFVTVDFTAEEHFAGLSLTLGRVLAPLLGGRLQAYAKPSLFVGQDRGANWGVETGLKLVGF